MNEFEPPPTPFMRSASLAGQFVKSGSLVNDHQKQLLDKLKANMHFKDGVHFVVRLVNAEDDRCNVVLINPEKAFAGIAENARGALRGALEAETGLRFTIGDVAGGQELKNTLILECKDLAAARGAMSIMSGTGYPVNSLSLQVFERTSSTHRMR